MLIYQLPVSLYSFKLRLALKLKGLSIPVSPPPGGSYASPEFRAINPAGTIPTLVDGEWVLSETDAIIEYLEESQPDRPLFPTGLRERARMRMLSRWVDLQLEPAIRRLFSQVAPAGRDREALPGMDGAISAKLSLIETSLDALGPFSLGARPSLPDCGLAATLIWLGALAPELGLAATPGPRLVRLRDAMAGQDDLAEEIADYRSLVSGWVEAKRSAAA